MISRRQLRAKVLTLVGHNNQLEIAVGVFRVRGERVNNLQ